MPYSTITENLKSGITVLFSAGRVPFFATTQPYLQPPSQSFFPLNGWANHLYIGIDSTCEFLHNERKIFLEGFL
jgi:hypothetical protein